MFGDSYPLPADSWDFPAKYAAAVTPNDTTVFAEPSKGLYIGATGNVVVHLQGDPATAVTFTGVPAGTVLPIRVVRVLSTGTTATGLVRMW